MQGFVIKGGAGVVFHIGGSETEESHSYLYDIMGFLEEECSCLCDPAKFTRELYIYIFFFLHFYQIAMYMRL